MSATRARWWASWGIAWGLGLAMLVMSSRAGAGGLERLVMPGPLAAAHADLEKDCGNCHQPFDRTSQRALCLECHEDVAADLSATRGFHGRLPQPKDLDCKSCHTDHAGRDADIVGLQRDAFLHQRTDFPLQGAHTRAPCASCHAEATKFRAASSDCVDCHAEDEPHQGRLGTRCADCHGVETWRSARFDHSKTHFPLVGRHQKVECQLCHPNERYRDTPGTCASCHQLDDAHRGSFGSDCGGCHSPRSWQKSGFDHDRDTRFPLRGAHARAVCQDCHRDDPRTHKLKTDCLSCHRSDDAHRGRNGPSCEKCHGTSSWKPSTFDHTRDTQFPLRGSHQSAACESCHARPPFEERLKTDCYACHEKDDVHAGGQGQDCGRCHDERSWTGEVRFDHELTRFPLLGIHAVTACEECHSGHVFRGTRRSCVACHKEDDVHHASLGPHCEQCHNPNGWPLWEFDHDLETDFPLRGRHDGLVCSGCHRTAVRGAIHLPKDCQGCHERDDAHRGAFGPDCGRCHSENSWSGALLMR